MKLRITDDIVRQYPDLRIALVTARGLDNTGRSEALEAELRAAEAAFRGRVPDAATLERDPRIQAWRDTYQSFRVNPKKFRPSAEALLRRVVNGSAVPWISKAVNAYLLAELEVPLPVGGYDLATLEGDIELRHSPGGELFRGIGSAGDEPTEAGEIIYGDARRVLTRRWNFRDCDHAKITEASRDIALCIEGPLPTIQTADLMVAARRIAEKLEQYCGARTATGLLDVRDQRDVEL